MKSNDVGKSKTSYSSIITEDDSEEENVPQPIQKNLKNNKELFKYVMILKNRLHFALADHNFASIPPLVVHSSIWSMYYQEFKDETLTYTIC